MLSIMLSLCMIFSMIPMSAFAAEAETPIVISDDVVSTTVTTEPAGSEEATGEKPTNTEVSTEPTVVEEPTEEKPTNTEAPTEPTVSEEPTEEDPTHTEVPTKICICDPVIEGEGVHTNPDCPLYVAKRVRTWRQCVWARQYPRLCRR